MFNRPYIKELAKQRMSGRMGDAIVICLLGLILGKMGTGIPDITFRFNQSEFSSHIWEKFFPFFFILFLGGIAFTILVGNVVYTGLRGWFMRYWRGENPQIGEVFIGFRRYSAFVGTDLLRDVYLFLWTLLLIIPGIVMGFAYSMSDYILYENPNLPASRVLEMSKRMTDGHKADLFVFYLSYIGWFLLSGITCGIVGIVYVNPYMYTAHAGIYEALKAEALNNGALRWEDFGMMPPPPAPPYPPTNYGMPQQF